MADQNAAPNEEQADTPEEEGTGVQEQSAQENWEERYKEAQAWGTRSAQRAAELEQEAQLVQQLKSDDPAVQRQALEALGYQVPEEEEEDTPAYEPDPRLRAELDELKQWKESLTETQQREQNYTEYREKFDPQLVEMEIPKGFHDVVADAALDLPPVQTPQGPQPDLQGAWSKLLELLKAGVEVPEVQSLAKTKWASTKPRSALTQAGGAEGTKVLDTDKHENRVAYMLAQLQNRE